MVACRLEHNVHIRSYGTPIFGNIFIAESIKNDINTLLVVKYSYIQYATFFSHRNQWAVSIPKCRLTSMGVPIMKIS